jgi:Na+-transporting NADH:ubiquinone oxidoreductase subunit NqrB
VVITYLILAALFGGQLIPRQVLQRNHLGVGDLLHSTRSDQEPFTEDSWLREPIVPGYDAIEMTPAARSLGSYTTGQASPDRSWSSLEALLRDRMPPLQDLILGSHPGPIGAASAIAVVIGGLFLLYRGLIDYRIPLLIVVTAFIALLILPIPWRITEHPEWRWAIGHVRGVGWPMGVTFANYEILASPLLFMSFFLATSPAVRPLTRRGRVSYSILIGLLAAVFQLYISVSFGCYLALLAVSLLTPTMDKWLRPRPLV